MLAARSIVAVTRAVAPAARRPLARAFASGDDVEKYGYIPKDMEFQVGRRRTELENDLKGEVSGRARGGARCHRGSEALLSSVVRVQSLLRHLPIPHHAEVVTTTRHVLLR
jgi:hypothetical protein